MKSWSEDSLEGDRPGGDPPELIDPPTRRIGAAPGDEGHTQSPAQELLEDAHGIVVVLVLGLAARRRAFLVGPSCLLSGFLGLRLLCLSRPGLYRIARIPCQEIGLFQRESDPCRIAPDMVF
jgi:hypothetical protein